MIIALRYLFPRLNLRRLRTYTKMASETSVPNKYSEWTREQLIARLVQIDERRALGPLQPQPKVEKKPFEFGKYLRRKIAIKFCYSGWEYGGLAFQVGPTPLPTVENVLFDVFVKTRLIDAEEGFEGCGWEKCGRTDRGVSSAGQVISLWVRSKLSPNGTSKDSNLTEATADLQVDDDSALIMSENSSISKKNAKHGIDPDYVGMLNRLLPETIRVLAWTDVPETFSARFSCKFRHYKYFFSSTQLDVFRMELAATRLIGDHDFRNLCKVDAQKQITRFRRTIMHASVSRLPDDEGGAEGIHVFDLVGTAFLYHQVRHIMGILFLVGTGLEDPSIVTQLMNVEEGAETPFGDEKYIPLNRKPEYIMADALPLMLWDCGYDDSELNWRTSGLPQDKEGPPRPGSTKLYHQMQNIYIRSQMYTTLNRHFLKSAEKFHRRPEYILPLQNGVEGLKALKERTGEDKMLSIPEGGGTFKQTRKYVPLLERNCLDTVEVINERWLKGRGQKLAKQGGSRGSGSPPTREGEEDDGDE